MHGSFGTVPGHRKATYSPQLLVIRRYACLDTQKIIVNFRKQGQIMGNTRYTREETSSTAHYQVCRIGDGGGVLCLCSRNVRVFI